MVNVLLKQQVIGVDKEAAFFELEYEPVFPPVPNLGIRVSPNTFSIIIGAVQYIISSQSYVAYAEPVYLTPKDETLDTVASDFIHAGYRRTK
jgi:hypothetical protein